MSKTIKYSSLTNFELEKIDKSKYLVIPIGSVEAHGHHLSMNNDNIIADYLAREVCIKTDSILCPQLQFGNTSKLEDFPGTINIRPEILKEYLVDILNSYIKAGFNNILIINGHRGNNQYIQEAIDNFKDKNIKFVFYKDIIKDDLDETYNGFHSNRIETELALIANKDSVKMDLVKDNLVQDRDQLKEKFPKTLMPDCIDGFPSKANVEEGKVVVEKIISKIVNLIE